MNTYRPQPLSSRTSINDQANPPRVQASSYPFPLYMNKTLPPGKHHPNMELTHYRGHQSLDNGRDWRQYTADQAPLVEQTPRELPVRGLASSAWSSPTPARNAKGWQWQPVTHYTTAPPTPAQADVLNSFEGRAGTNGQYAYFLDRGQGRVTRLIPADMLPPLNEIPTVEVRGFGMEVLPHLRAPPPNGVPETNQRVTVQDPQFQPAPVSPSTQKNIDRSVPTGPSTPKKSKVYCDKWIHEGVCAFTQQGCRYKHEMPYDKAVQHSLGLFQGLPAWWRKRQADTQRLRDGAPDADQPQQQGLVEEPRAMTPGLKGSLAGSVPDSLAGGPSWRKEDVPNVRRTGRPISTNGPVAPCIYPFGPIEPPRKLTQ